LSGGGSVNAASQFSGETRRVGPQSVSPRRTVMVHGVEMQRAFDLCSKKGCLRYDACPKVSRNSCRVTRA
jgi:hypothetical protein